MSGLHYATFCEELRRRANTAPEPHEHALPHLLGRIATRSYEDKQVVITALIHYKGGNEPGPGFYEIGLPPESWRARDCWLSLSSPGPWCHLIASRASVAV